MTILKTEKKKYEIQKFFRLHRISHGFTGNQKMFTTSCMHVNWIQLALQNQQHSDPDVSLIA